MYSSIHPAELAPDQRRRELTRILAAGVLRLRKLRLLRETSEEPASDSAADRLDVPAKTVLSGHDELTAREAKRSEPTRC